MANEELAAFKERVSEERRKSEKAREAELVAMRRFAWLVFGVGGFVGFLIGLLLRRCE